MRHAAVLAIASSLALVACGNDHPGPLAPSLAPLGDRPLEAVTYDEVVMKTSHNAYASDEPIFDQLVYHRIRSLELDVHTGKSGERAPPSNWFVYHADLPFFRKTSCQLFTDCLAQIAAFHRAVPEHEVVTLFVDLKDGFSPGHSAEELDRTIDAALGHETIVTPRDLLAHCPSAPTLRGAVSSQCRFPDLAALRGKIIVAVTGGTLCDGDSHVSAYAERAMERLAFVAPNVGGECPIERYDARPEAIFFNMRLSEKRWAQAVRSRGLVARIYKGGLAGGLDTPAELAAARASGAQLLATDRVNADADTWSTTCSARGWPFLCAGRDAFVEPGNVFSLRARSGDIGDTRDSAFFAFERGEGAALWSAFVSVPSSHVERDAKGCLMVRASEAPDAASVALCRPFDDGAPRLVVRAARGQASATTEMQPIAGAAAEAPAFLRLFMAPAGADTEVVGEASLDGRTWSRVGAARVAGSLPLRGVSVASRGADAVKAIFGNVVHSSSGAMRAASFGSQVAIGGATGEIFDGVAH
jgi:hypothetical protein